MLIDISRFVLDSTGPPRQHDSDRRPHHRRKHGVWGTHGLDCTGKIARGCVLCFRTHKIDRNETVCGWSLSLFAMGSETFVESLAVGGCA